VYDEQWQEAKQTTNKQTKGPYSPIRGKPRTLEDTLPDFASFDVTVVVILDGWLD
jgi:hypothetical protein